MPTLEILTEDLSITTFQPQQVGKTQLLVDREAGVIRNVKIIGFNSQNGRRYTSGALKAAIPLYEGIKVNVDHPEKGPTQQRSSYDRFGKFVNVRFVEGEGLFGDLVYLKSHPIAEQVCEAAERMPDVFGMSHNAQGEGIVDKRGIFEVNKITEVRHVDLVADPATTQSLAESKQATKQETEEAAYSGVYRKSKKRPPQARRNFVKSKSQSANKPTGSIKEADENSQPVDAKVDDGEKMKKDLHYKVMQILTRDDLADDQKADELIDFLADELGDIEMDATEAVKDTEEAMDRIDDKPKEDEKDSSDDTEEGMDADKKADSVDAEEKMDTCEKCGSKMKPMKESDDSDMDDKEMGKERMKPVKESKDPQAELAYLKAKDKIRDLCEASGVKFEESLVEDLSSLEESAMERQIKRIAAAYVAAKPKCPPASAPLQESKGSSIPEGESLFRWLQN
jgi:hypothetical protein